MVGEFRSEILSGFICGAALLLIMSVNGSDSANSSKNYLRQISSKNYEMLNDAETLLTKSFTEHDIPEEDCNETLEWFTKPNISNLKDVKRLLKEVDRNLNRFYKAFTHLKINHTDELTHTEMIAQALLSMEAQRKNIQDFVKSENGVNGTGPAIPDRDFYQRKLDCCKLSNIYVAFLRNVSKGLKKHSQRRKKRNKTRLVYQH